MKKIMYLVLPIVLLSVIPVYSVYEVYSSGTVNPIQPFMQIQYEPNPTPDPTPLPQAVTDVTVIDANTKQPIEGAQVVTHYVEYRVNYGYTDAEGNYTYTHDEYTVSYVEISKAYYEALVIEGEAIGVYELVPITLDPDNHYEIQGTVTDMDTGAPIENVSLRIRSYHNDKYDSESITTDAFGYYSVTLDSGTTAELVASFSGYTPSVTNFDPGIYTHNIYLNAIPPGTGDVWISPATLTVNENQDFTVEIHANSGEQKFAAYGFDLYYDPNILYLQNIIAGADGFVAALSGYTPGNGRMSGFHVSGTGPGTDLHIVTVEFHADLPGTSLLDLVIGKIADINSVTIGIPNAIDGQVTVTRSSLGDVNSDGEITIVDALLVARYYVSRDPSILDLSLADVNNSGEVDIIDALLIAQYYVGLISSF